MKCYTLLKIKMREKYLSNFNDIKSVINFIWKKEENYQYFNDNYFKHENVFQKLKMK